MDGTDIGKHKGEHWYNLNRGIAVDQPSITNATHEQAVSVAQQSASADLIVPHTGSHGEVSYDVYPVHVGGDRRIAGTADKNLAFIADVPGAVHAPEAVLVDEANHNRVFMRPGESNDRGYASHAVTHAKQRDLSGAETLAAAIGDGAMRSDVTASLTHLKAIKGDLEANEATFTLQLTDARGALETKRVPFDVAIQAASQNLDSTRSEHAQIVNDRSEALREAQNPGVHVSEQAVTTAKQQVQDANDTVGRAKGKRHQGQEKIKVADGMSAQLDSDKSQLYTVQNKLRDGADAKKDYDRDMVGYKEKLATYTAAKAKYDAAVKDPTHKPGDPLPPNPTAPVEPKFHTPTSWSREDRQSDLVERRDFLQNEIATLPGLESAKRGEGNRMVGEADGELRYAERDLDKANDGLRDAQSHLANLPTGPQAGINQAQGALTKAQNAQNKAIVAAETTLADAKTALNDTIKGDVAKISSLEQALTNAPNVYQAEIAALAHRLGL